MRTRDQLVTTALRKCGALGDTETATAEQLAIGAIAVNSVLAAFVADGMPLWRIEQVTEPLSSFVDTTPLTVGVGATIVTSERPVKLLGAWRVITADETRTPMHTYTRDEYYNIQSPADTGAPIVVYFQPLKTTGKLSIWPLPDTSWQTDGELALDFQCMFTNTTAGSDVLDYPDHWELAITYAIARLIAPEYGVSINERQLLTTDAKEFKIEALSNGNEEGSIFIRPRRYR